MEAKTKEALQKARATDCFTELCGYAAGLCDLEMAQDQIKVGVS